MKELESTTPLSVFLYTGLTRKISKSNISKLSNLIFLKISQIVVLVVLYRKKPFRRKSWKDFPRKSRGKPKLQTTITGKRLVRLCSYSQGLLPSLTSTSVSNTRFTTISWKFLGKGFQKKNFFPPRQLPTLFFEKNFGPRELKIIPFDASWMSGHEDVNPDPIRRQVSPQIGFKVVENFGLKGKKCQNVKKRVFARFR